MNKPDTYVSLDSAIKALDVAAPNSKAQVLALRRRMDAACDSRAITIKEWRVLLDRIASFQSLTGNSGSGSSSANPTGFHQVGPGRSPSEQTKTLLFSLGAVRTGAGQNTPRTPGETS